MSEEPQNNTYIGKEKTGFLDYFMVLWRWRMFIIVNWVAVTLLAVGVSLILPKWYKATATILPPKDQGLLNFFGGSSPVLKGLTSLTKIGGLNQSSGSYNYFAILKSRTAMESVIRKFDLFSAYDIGDSSMMKAIKALKENVAFELEDDDYITIDVFDKDPYRAAEMANYFVDVLNELSIDLGTREAKNNREFIERRLQQTRDSLRRAEETLKQFQEKSGLLVTPEQASSISALAELYAMKAKKEIEIAILEKSVTSDNYILQQSILELKELDRKLSTFPKAGLESLRLYREVVTHQKIEEFLLPLFEQAKINEQKNIPVLLVLDQAVPPELKAKPKRLLIVMTVSVLFLFFAVMLVYLMEGILREKGAANNIILSAQLRIRRIASFYRAKITV